MAALIKSWDDCEGPASYVWTEYFKSYIRLSTVLLKVIKKQKNIKHGYGGSKGLVNGKYLSFWKEGTALPPD